jgi:hypothetical protein
VNQSLIKPWFDEECLKLVDRRKQAKLQWLQVPSLVNEDNLRNVRREASRCFRNKKREYLKGKFTDIEFNSKNKNIRDLYRVITEFKKRFFRACSATDLFIFTNLNLIW